MKQAWLILQEIKDKTGRPVLEACSRDSIANSLLSMVVQGLSPEKKQGYFIAYGKTLTFQRSYFGTMAVAKRVCPDIAHIYHGCVYEGDEFEYEIWRGKTVITKHAQKLSNIDKSKIVAAYCTILYKDDSEESTIMTIDQIKQSWKMSKMNPVNDKGAISANSTHGKFTADMCEKTVINRACKPIINSSDDKSLVIRYARSSDQDAVYAEMREETAENANTQTIEIDDYEIDAATGEVVDVQDDLTTPDEPDEPELLPPADAPAEQLAMADGPGY